LLADKAKQVAGGAILGKVTDNLIGALTPRLKEGARELMDKGVPVSPGQAYEGAPGWLFRQIESFGLGPKADKINKAFNGVVADDVLSTLGQRVPSTVKPGQQAVAYTQRQISKYYDDSLLSLGKNPLDELINAEWGKIFITDALGQHYTLYAVNGSAAISEDMLRDG
jgi:hypothetical protein